MKKLVAERQKKARKRQAPPSLKPDYKGSFRSARPDKAIIPASATINTSNNLTLSGTKNRSLNTKLSTKQVFPEMSSPMTKRRTVVDKDKASDASISPA